MTTTDIRPALAPRPSRLGEAARWFVRQTGPLSKPLAGRRFVTIWAIVSYRGRRSGKEYSAPIAIGRSGDFFVIPLPFAGAQWVLNVLAANECTIRWNGREWRASEPQVIDKAEGATAFGPIPRFALRFLPIDRFLRLRRVEA